MMVKRKGAGALLVAAAFMLPLVSACRDNQVLTTTQIQSNRMDERKAIEGHHHEQMVDNAAIRNMALCDHHFVAHTSELSGTGTKKLERLTPYLNHYGGTVRYETYIEDHSLVEQRLAHIREYLDVAGCDMSRVEVARMMVGGDGMTGREAIEANIRGTSRPDPRGGGADPSQQGTR